MVAPKALGKFFKGRFAVFFTVLGVYLMLSLVIRFVFLIWSAKDIVSNALFVLQSFLLGFAFDVATGLGFLFLYAVYLLFFPKKWIGNAFDKAFTYSYLAIVLLIIYFSFMAEIPFWEEFGVRFNFIAVDYLIYTYEVVSNINQSYPLPLIIIALIVFVLLTFVLLKKAKAFKYTFSSKVSFLFRIVYGVPVILICFLLLNVMKNKWAGAV